MEADALRDAAAGRRRNFGGIRLQQVEPLVDNLKSSPSGKVQTLCLEQQSPMRNKYIHERIKELTESGVSLNGGLHNMHVVVFGYPRVSVYKRSGMSS